MGQSKLSILVYALIGLAAVGIVSQLLTNTASFFTNILIMLGVGAALFGIFYLFIQKRRAPSNDMKKYKKAVKQSKAKYKSHPSNMQAKAAKKHQPASIKKKTSRRAGSHLRVIDGNKSKKKRPG
ncbi:SA1362 family protein [Virgibacillus xinjiangensis]|uniref:SA1362 family protein n=1 Tax=Virgibacillus xinjiangensis TaxID=393090 RepID=A0ABV7CRK9_9BACI